MGLTISWHLTLPGGVERHDVRTRMGTLRERCLAMPFERIGELLALEGEGLAEYRRENFVWGDLCFSVTVGAEGRARAAPPGDHSGRMLTAEAIEVVGFPVWPGGGCETAHFCVARVPDVISWVNPDMPHLGEQEIRVPRHEGRWYGSGGSKTQYAAHPDHGGPNHFLKCHLGLIAVLQDAYELGFGVEVNDAGGYWQERDVEKLMRQLHDWNQTVARIVGGFKDAMEGNLEGVFVAPITARPDFEHLEAGGGAPGRPDLSDPAVSALLHRTRARPPSSYLP